MSQQNHNDVKAVTQVIISELLKNFSNSSDLIRSLDTVADLFIQSVLKYNLFKENNYFTREIQIITEDEFLDSILQIKQGDKASLKGFAEYISHKESKKFQFEVPYEYITDYVYSNDLNIEYVVVEDRLNSFAQCISGNISDLDDSEIKTLEKVFRKFRRHLLLAIYQKKYIDDVTKNEAKNAGVIANKAQIIANAAQKIANKAKSDSEKAEKLAEKAEDLASEADNQAKSTIANYISILGIFASIIFTLFGGVNLIGSTVKLLETSSRLPYLVFIVSLLMICLLTLLNMMVKWVNSMSNLKNALEKHSNVANQHLAHHCWKVCQWDFYTKSVSFFLVILLISLGGMYNVNKENLFSITTETTTKSVPNVEENTNKPATKLESEDKNKEITVVEKITLSNHPNEKSSDKEE